MTIAALLDNVIIAWERLEGLPGADGVENSSGSAQGAAGQR